MSKTRKSTYAAFDPRFALQPQSEILPGLFMGMRPPSYVGYDLVISCEMHLARQPMGDYEGMTLHLPMLDEDDFILDRSKIEAAAELAATIMDAGGKVLVHCTGGLNRSGVVVVGIVRQATNCTAAEALQAVRKRRDEYVLCNRAFERWVLGDVLPTAKTSAFRTEVSDEVQGDNHESDAV